MLLCLPLALILGVIGIVKDPRKLAAVLATLVAGGLTLYVILSFILLSD